MWALAWLGPMPLSYRLGNRYKSATVRILVARYNNRVEIVPPNEEFLVSFFMNFFWRFCDSIMLVSFLSIVFFVRLFNSLGQTMHFKS